MADDDFKFDDGGVEDNAESSLDDFFQPADSGEEPSIDDFFTEPLPAEKSQAGPGLTDGLDLGGTDEVPGVETDQNKKAFKPALPSGDDEPLAAPLEAEAPLPPGDDEDIPGPPEKKGSAAKILIIAGLVMVVLLLGISGSYLVVTKFFSPKEKDKTDTPVAKNDMTKPDVKKDGPKTGAADKTDTPKSDADPGKKTDTVKTDIAKTDTAKSDADPGKKTDKTKSDTPKTDTAKSDADAGKKTDTAKADLDAGKKTDTAKADLDAGKKTDKPKDDKAGVAAVEKPKDKPEDKPKNKPIDKPKSGGDDTMLASTGPKTAPPQPEKSAKTSSHQPVGSDGGAYSIQIGSYYMEASKQGPLDRLAELGYTEHHFTPEHRRLKLFHVVVGEGLGSGEARELQSRLEAEGYAAELYDGGVKAYSYGSLAVAQKTRQKLISEGFKSVRIKTELKTVTLDQLRVGQYSKSRADKAVRDLRRSGFKEAYVVRN